MSPPNPEPGTPASVTAQILQLPDLPMTEIKAIWKDLFHADTPTPNRHFLERRFAPRLQEIDVPRVDSGLMDRNKRRVQQLLETGRTRQLDRDIRMMPG